MPTFGFSLVLQKALKAVLSFSCIWLLFMLRAGGCLSVARGWDGCQISPASTAPAFYDNTGGVVAAAAKLELFDDEAGSYLQQEEDGRPMVCSLSFASWGALTIRYCVPEAFG